MRLYFGGDHMDLIEAEQRIKRLEDFFDTENQLSVVNRFILLEKKINEWEDELRKRPVVNEVQEMQYKYDQEIEEIKTQLQSLSSAIQTYLQT